MKPKTEETEDADKPIKEEEDAEPQQKESKAGKGRKQNQLDVSLKAVEKLKQRYLSCTALTTVMLSSIAAKKKGWMWGDNDQNKGVLQTLYDKCTTELADKNLSTMLHAEPKKLKKDVGADELQKKCASFLALEGAVTDLEAMYQTMWKRHLADPESCSS